MKYSIRYVSTTASRGLLDKVHAEEFVSTLVSLSQPIAHLHDDVTRAVHYGCSSKDRESLKKMVASDAKHHENKEIQGHSKSENFKKKIVLNEDDVPGASFKNKDPQIFHNEQLKRWLKCRGASVGGSRRELLTRFVVLSVFFCQDFKN